MGVPDKLQKFAVGVLLGEKAQRLPPCGCPVSDGNPLLEVSTSASLGIINGQGVETMRLLIAVESRYHAFSLLVFIIHGH